MELAAFVAEALFAGAKGTEVLYGLGDDIIEELEVDTAFASCDGVSHLSILSEDGGRCRSGLPLSVLSMPVCLPEPSTVISGPVHSQSKKTFLTMLAVDAWNARLKFAWRSVMAVVVDRIVGRSCLEMVFVERSISSRAGHWKRGQLAVAG